MSSKDLIFSLDENEYFVYGDTVKRLRNVCEAFVDSNTITRYSKLSALNEICDELSKEKSDALRAALSPLKNEIYDIVCKTLYILFRSRRKEFVGALFSKEFISDGVIEIPSVLQELNSIVSFGRAGVIGRGEITFSLLIPGSTIDPGGAYDVIMSNRDVWHIKDASFKGALAASIAPMGKPNLWDLNAFPISLFREADVKVKTFGIPAIHECAFEIAALIDKKYGQVKSNEFIAREVQSWLDNAFRTSKVWGDAKGIITLDNDKFIVKPKEKIQFGRMSGQGAPEYTLRENRYYDAIISALDINHPSKFPEWERDTLISFEADFIEK